MVLSLSSNLRIDVDLFLPVRSEFLKGVVAVVLVLSMIIGLNLRRLFPKFSAFAWGIPSLTMLTVLLQMCFVGFLLAFEFWKIQTGSGRLIAPDRRDSGLTRIKWNRKKKRH
jgi:hypothetical protein